MALHTPTPAAVYGDSEKQQMLSDLEVSFDLEKLATLLNELHHAMVCGDPTEASEEEVACGKSYKLVLYKMGLAGVTTTHIQNLSIALDAAVIELRQRALRKV